MDVSLLQKILVQVFLKLVFVLIAYRNVGFAEDDTAALDGVDLIEVDNERPVHPHKLIFGQFLFERLDGIERQNWLVIARCIYFDVVFQPFDVKDIIEIDTPYFVFRFQEQKLAVCFN
jgi:hypothetical protein